MENPRLHLLKDDLNQLETTLFEVEDFSSQSAPFVGSASCSNFNLDPEDTDERWYSLQLDRTSGSPAEK